MVRCRTLSLYEALKNRAHAGRHAYAYTYPARGLPGMDEPVKVHWKPPHPSPLPVGEGVDAILILAESVAVAGFCRGMVPVADTGISQSWAEPKGPFESRRAGRSGAAPDFAGTLALRAHRLPLRARPGRIYFGNGTRHRTGFVRHMAGVDDLAPLWRLAGADDALGTDLVPGPQFWNNDPRPE